MSPTTRPPVDRFAATSVPLLQLPPITVSCSHEHSTWHGTASISAATVYAMVNDIDKSIATSGLTSLVILNGHGGSYVLSNVVQEANAQGKLTALFPAKEDWAEARQAARLASSGHEDIHAANSRHPSCCTPTRS